LALVPQIHRHWRAAACLRAARKTATNRSLRSPTSSAETVTVLPFRSLAGTRSALLKTYATSSDGKILSPVLISFIDLVTAGNETRDSKLQSHFQQCQRCRTCRSFRYSDHSGAISSLLHWTQVIPNLERRLDSIVVMVISLIPLRCDAKW